MNALLAALITLVALAAQHAAPPAREPEPAEPRIQVAILLDTSGSMDGLIHQARTQLWAMVNEWSRAEREGARPRIEVALYRYGMNEKAEDDHVECLLPFTGDLDRVSERLFALAVGGGNEYCGAVIRRAVDELTWSDGRDDLKVILIAGNESFAQGAADPVEACRAAIGRGILVNALFCGPGADGERLGWKEGPRAADGEYLSIDAQREAPLVAAPQDEEILRLNEKLNWTYIPYGPQGGQRAERQRRQDQNAVKASRRAALERAAFKGSDAYRNADWDLLDALEQGKVRLRDLPPEHLPKTMRGMTLAEQQALVARKLDERRKLRERLAHATGLRRRYLEEKLTAAAGGEELTLEQAVTRATRRQAIERKFTFRE